MSFAPDTPSAHIIGVFRQLLAAKRTAPNKAARNWNHLLLKWACREILELVTPDVSVATYERATEAGLPDPRQVKWREQVAKLKDKGRKIIVLEHVLPVSDMINRLEILGPDPTDAQIEAVIKLANMVWILRDEDEKLTSAS